LKTLADAMASARSGCEPLVSVSVGHGARLCSAGISQEWAFCVFLRHWTIEGPLVYARGPSAKKAIASSILVGEMRKWPW
jgi:hypothetical protein